MIVADYEPLASPEDVQAVLQRELTSTEATAADKALGKASRLFRRESMQIFTPGSSVVRLKVNPASKTASEFHQIGRHVRLDRMGAVYLRQRPVVAVASVLDDYGDTVVYEHMDQWLFVEGLQAADFVRVSYTHGAEEVPEDVVQTVAEMVARSLPVPEQIRTGATSVMEVTGPFTDQVQYAAWAVGGTVQMSPEEKSLAQSYRQRTPALWVQRP